MCPKSFWSIGEYWGEVSLTKNNKIKAVKKKEKSPEKSCSLCLAMAPQAGPSSEKKRKVFLKEDEILKVLEEVLDQSGSDFDFESSGSEHESTCISDRSEDEGMENASGSNRERDINKNLNMSWSVSGTSFIPEIHKFDNSESGVKPGMFHENSKESDYFMSLLTPEIVQAIVQETNQYANQKIRAGQFTPSSYLGKWKNTEVDEMYVFLALMMLNSSNKKRDMKLQWSTDPLLHTPIFGKIMSRDRFFTILSMLHFSNNDE